MDNQETLTQLVQIPLKNSFQWNIQCGSSCKDYTTFAAKVVSEHSALH